MLMLTRDNKLGVTAYVLCVIEPCGTVTPVECLNAFKAVSHALYIKEYD